MVRQPGGGYRRGVKRLKPFCAFALVAVLALAAAAPAPAAVTLLGEDGQTVQPLQRWADALRVPTADARVVVAREPCPTGVEPACTLDGDPIRMWLARTRSTAIFSRYMLRHELGHVFDYVAMTQAARDGFEMIMRDPRPWRSPPNSPHEQFAEAYGLCGADPRSVRWDYLGAGGHRDHVSIILKGDGVMDPGFDYTPTRRQQQRVCALIRRQAQRAKAFPSERLKALR
jgi:hypothetical protein